ncbi:hypothetical protein J7413_14325 [Shimia sp. R10_1]|uniref:hypothetical protein n=1 Tax=Shimia sp. R10_1 TaxID=2821095 RepID=UPI001ADAB6EF|nr:hypothetical protein [Shimia sp. R10_1]MBO9474722.1 hypothetical protein [Shimia sp. R10_1]
MNFLNLPISALVVNKNNDRHGETPSEDSAIAWLFEHHGPKMVALAESIVESKRIFDAPLVKPVEDKFVVFDGNRRVTCLKLLADPSHTPEPFRKKFEGLSQASGFTLESLIACQVEHNQHEIDQALSRRHNGTDGGRGQLGWDPRAKANHANRTGGTNQYPIAEAIEVFLTEQGYPDADRVGRSTMYRLMNAKKRQRQFGIFLKPDNTLGLSRPKEDVISLLSKVANDIQAKNLTLNNLLKVQNVEEYLKTLRDYGLNEETPPVPNPTEKVLPASPRSPKRPPKRDTLIPNHVEYTIQWRPNQGKMERLWQELQFKLYLDRHELAIPIVFRSLLELATNRYIATQNLRQGKSLALSIKVAVEHLEKIGSFSPKEAKDLARLLGDTKSSRELEALHRVVHSNSFSISKNDLISLWEGFERYLVEAIQSKAQR